MTRVLVDTFKMGFVLYRTHKFNFNTKKPPIQTYIVSVDQYTQNNILDKIQAFVKYTTLVNLKNYAYLNVRRIITIAKWASIIGATATILWYVYRLIKNIFDSLNKQFGVEKTFKGWYDYISDLYKQSHEMWIDSNKNIFIFLDQNWNNETKLKEVVTVTTQTIVDELQNTIITAFTELSEYTYNCVSNVFNKIYNYFKFKKEPLSNSEQQSIDELVNDFDIKTRSIYDDKIYSIRDDKYINKDGVVKPVAYNTDISPTIIDNDANNAEQTIISPDENAEQRLKKELAEYSNEESNLNKIDSSKNTDVNATENNLKNSNTQQNQLINTAESNAGIFEVLGFNTFLDKFKLVFSSINDDKNDYNHKIATHNGSMYIQFNHQATLAFVNKLKAIDTQLSKTLTTNINAFKQLQNNIDF